MYRILIIGFFLLALTNLLYAWQCQNSSLEENYKNAEIVFTGRVDTVSKPKKKGTDRTIEITFRVMQLWKGPAQNEIKASAVYDSKIGDAGFGNSFKEGDDWLVFVGTPPKGKYWIDQCKGTKLVSESGQDLKRLNKINFENEK